MSEDREPYTVPEDVPTLPSPGIMASMNAVWESLTGEPTAGDQPAGRELDRALALALGWKPGSHTSAMGVQPPARWILPDGSLWLGDCPFWSADSRFALGPLCDAMRARGWLLELEDAGTKTEPWGARFVKGARSSDRFYTTLPAESIARAAKAALESEVPHA